MATPQTIEHNIQFENRCQLAEEKLKIFAGLFLELFPMAQQLVLPGFGATG